MAGMVCFFPRGASKNSCSLDAVLTCKSFPDDRRHSCYKDSQYKAYKRVSLRKKIHKSKQTKKIQHINSTTVKFALIFSNTYLDYIILYLCLYLIVFLTSFVPVQVSDVVHGAFAYTHPLAAHHVVYIHKGVTWGYCQIFPCTCGRWTHLSALTHSHHSYHAKF